MAEASGQKYQNDLEMKDDIDARENNGGITGQGGKNTDEEAQGNVNQTRMKGTEDRDQSETHTKQSVKGEEKEAETNQGTKNDNNENHGSQIKGDESYPGKGECMESTTDANGGNTKAVTDLNKIEEVVDHVAGNHSNTRTEDEKEAEKGVKYECDNQGGEKEHDEDQAKKAKMNPKDGESNCGAIQKTKTCKEIQDAEGETGTINDREIKSEVASDEVTLRQQLNSAEDQIKRIATEYAELTEKYNELIRNHNRLTNECTVVKDKNKTLNELLTTHADTIKKLAHECDGFKVKNKELEEFQKRNKDTIKKFSQECQSLKDQNKRLKESLANQTKTINGQKDSLKKLTEQKSEAEQNFKSALESLESTNKRLKRTVEELELTEKQRNAAEETVERTMREVSRRDQQIWEANEKLRQYEASYNSLHQTARQYQQHTVDLQRQKTDLQKYAKDIEEDRESLLLRLSKIAGSKLVSGNPDIADLSDEHRPTKLCEIFSELYDNEWTEAFEELEEGSDEHKIQVLLNMLKAISEVCDEMANNQRKSLLCVSYMPKPSAVQPKQAKGPKDEADNHLEEQPKTTPQHDQSDAKPADKPEEGSPNAEEQPSKNPQLDQTDETEEQIQNKKGSKDEADNQPEEQPGTTPRHGQIGSTKPADKPEEGSKDKVDDQPEEQPGATSEHGQSDATQPADNPEEGSPNAEEQPSKNPQLNQTDETEEQIQNKKGSKDKADDQSEEQPGATSEHGQSDATQPDDNPEEGFQKAKVKHQEQPGTNLQPDQMGKTDTEEQMKKEKESKDAVKQESPDTKAHNDQNDDYHKANGTESLSEVGKQQEPPETNQQTDLSNAKQTTDELLKEKSELCIRVVKEEDSELLVDIKDFRKKLSTKVLTAIKEEVPKYIAKQFNISLADHSAIEIYLKSCVKICWLAGLQDPPVYIRFDEVISGEEKFDKTTYREYTKSGPKMDYIVWPPLFLHKGGPLLGKGTAQGMK